MPLEKQVWCRGNCRWLEHARTVSSLIRYEALCLHLDAIHRRGGGNVESPIVLIAPIEICRLLWHHDCAEMVAVSVPDPDAFRPGNKEVAVLIHFHSIWYDVALPARLLAKDAAVPQRSVVRNIVYADVLFSLSST
jgi:hypothetical protein